MKLSELQDQFWADVLDESVPHAFTPAYLLVVFNEGLRQACLRKDLILEVSNPRYCIRSTPVTEAYTEGELKLEPGTTRVRYATWLADDSEETEPTVLAIKDRTRLDRERPNWRTEEGDRPIAIVVEDTKLYLVPGIISTAGELTMEVWRLAKPLADKADVPEIGEVHHEKLVLWAKHRALRRPDTELQDVAAANAARDEFDSWFGPAPDADQLRNAEEDPPAVKAWV